MRRTILLMGIVALTLAMVTPPAAALESPVASFTYLPTDPSVFDLVEFVDGSYDPAGVAIQSWAWDFGDGTTSTASDPTHTYANDGDYTVQLTVTNSDGLVASSSQNVAVRTHDVSILKFIAAPAKVGQTRTFLVALNNTRYPETVTVEFCKGTGPPSCVPFGNSQPTPVPVRPAATAVGAVATFAYTFTVADVGTQTFYAHAVVGGYRDASDESNWAGVMVPVKP